MELCSAKGAMEVRPSRGSARECQRRKGTKGTMSESPSEVRNGIGRRGNNGLYIRCQLLLTRTYIYYVNTRLTCDKSCPKSDGPCASWCPIAFE